MWGNKGYDQIIDDEEEQENHHHHIFRFKTLHRNPITSLIILGIIIVAVIFCIRFFFASPTAALVTDGVIVYIKLQSGQYLTGSKTGGVKTTAVPWLNGSRFELKQMSRTKYQLSSLASNTAIVIDSSTNKIRGEDDYYGNPLVLTRKSGSSFEYESRHRLEVDKEGSLVVSTSSHIPYALFTVEPVEKIKGTNIGSWLIPERWMYSPFYDGVDVYFSQVCGLVATLGIPAAEKRIIEHLDTWFTEKDMDQLVAVGVRHIRIPIGFWNLVPSKLAKKFVPQNVSTSLKYLDWAMDETAKRGITVMLDFHGGPGSQNGWDHSGCGYDSPDGHAWNTEENRNLSLEGIEVLASRYGHRENLIGIELLNEPASDLERKHHKDLLEFYQAGYHIVRKHSKKALVIFSVLWEEYYDNWSGEMLEPEYYNVVMDWHSYGFDNMGDQQQAGAVIHMRDLIEKHSQFHPIVIGEWSDFYHPARVEDTPAEPDQKFLDRQVTAYESAWGWYFWNFKVLEKGFDGWSMEILISKGYDFHLKPASPKRI